MTLVRQVLNARELEMQRWWADACSCYIRPWYRKPTWFVGWFVRWLRGV